MPLEKRSLSFAGKSFDIVCDAAVMWTWFTFDDEAEVRERWWKIQPGDVVLDIGACCGSYALPALALGASRVIAWSPDEHEWLARNFEANGWQEKTTTLSTGLWSRPGWLHAHEHNRLPEYHESCPEAWKTNRPRYAFQVDTLDNALAKLAQPIDRIDWLKLDVEGAEVEVLRGAEQTLRRLRPRRILIENHIFKDPKLPGEINAHLSGALGYREVATVPFHAISHSLYVADGVWP